MQKQSNLPSLFLSAKPTYVAGVRLATLSGCADKPAAEADEAAATTTKEAKTVAITQIVEHPSLDEIRRGIIEELADSDYIEGQNLTVTSKVRKVILQLQDRLPNSLQAICQTLSLPSPPLLHKLSRHQLPLFLLFTPPSQIH